MALPRRARFLLWGLPALVIALGIACISLLTVPAPLERRLQASVLEALRQHYGRDVQLENLHVTLIPVFRVTADNFVLPNRDPALPPFLTVKHLTATALPIDLLRKPIHLMRVKLEGMVINVPAKGTQKHTEEIQGRTPLRLANFQIDRVEADGTELNVLSKQAGREPMNWELRTLTLRSAGAGQAMHFQAELTNPKPPGIIHTTGTFGPWNFDEPSDTPVSGHYIFQNADLSVFNGISGILSSTGDYTGVLQNIVVDGTTDTPDFKLDNGAKAVHLSTQFHAIVDGTNGNTYLQPVKAHFLNSNLTATGEVAGRPGEHGKTVTLRVDVRNASVQDLLQLAVDSAQPMLTGTITAHVKMVVPPGKQKALDKLQVAGDFDIRDGRFTSDNVKQAVVSLSRRAQGRPSDESIQDVPAELSGTFTLGNSDLHFSGLQFGVPGVDAQVKGSYALRSETIDLKGDVRLQAHVSQTMTGANRILLKPVDPLFARHHAGTYLPVNISGAKEHPQIKLDVKKVF